MKEYYIVCNNYDDIYGTYESYNEALEVLRKFDNYDGDLIDFVYNRIDKITKETIYKRS